MERLFGLTNSESNHGEDVKEYCFYLNAHAISDVVSGNDCSMFLRKPR